MTKIKRLSFFNPHYIQNRLTTDILIKYKDFARGVLLDIGSGESPYREIFTPSVVRYISLDYISRFNSKIEGIDINADCRYLPFKPNSFETILSTHVLEHVRDPRKLLSEAYSVLKDNGYLIIVVPQTWSLHSIPNDYHRFTEYGIRDILNNCSYEVIKIEKCGRFWTMQGQMFNNYINYSFCALPGGRISFSRFIHLFIRLVSPVIFFMVQFLSFCLDKIDKLNHDTLSYIVIAEKRKK
jgi:SAM-dependent methyltransferase